MFEKYRKSLILQYYERQQSQTVLPDKSILLGQKSIEIVKIQMRHFDRFLNNVHRYLLLLIQ